MSAIDTFVKHILEVTAPSTNIGSGIIPSLTGVVNPQIENTRELHYALKEFAQALMAGKDSQQQADAVEGKIMALATLGTIPEATSEALIDELHNLSAANV